MAERSSLSMIFQIVSSPVDASLTRSALKMARYAALSVAFAVCFGVVGCAALDTGFGGPSTNAEPGAASAWVHSSDGTLSIAVSTSTGGILSINTSTGWTRAVEGRSYVTDVPTGAMDVETVTVEPRGSTGVRVYVYATARVHTALPTWTSTGYVCC